MSYSNGESRSEALFGVLVEGLLDVVPRGEGSGSPSPSAAESIWAPRVDSP